MLRDLRYALRVLRQNPGFALVAILSLALGIGANAAIFSLADALLLRPMPVPRPSAVMTVESQQRGEGISGLASFSGISYPDYKDIRDKNTSFEGLSATRAVTFGFSPQTGAIPSMKFGEFVSGNFFDVMGIQPKPGRAFRPDEDQVEGRDAVVVLSHDLWKSDFASAADAVGRTIYLNGIPFSIIGVAPESFTGSIPLLHSALYVPLAMTARLAADPESATMQRRDYRDLTVHGRLKPGVGLSAAAAEAHIIGQQLSQAYPATDRTSSLTVETDLQARLHQDTFDAELLAFLAALSAVVLLIACANVMNLMLSRARARSREIAVRLAIGASRARLIRQSLVESLVIAVLGGVFGLFVAQAGVAVFSQIHVPSDIPVVIDPRLDPRVLIFSFCAAIGSALIFGLAPAFQSTRPDLAPALKTGRGPAGKRHRLLGRNTLVVAQVAASLLLLVFASQAYRGANILLSSPLGFRTDHLLLANFDPSLNRYKPEQTAEFYRHLVDQARGLTGVKAAALGQNVPLMPGGIDTTRVIPEGFQLPPGTAGLTVLSEVVTEDYFTAIGMPIVSGREFRLADRKDTPLVAIVNEQFAHKYYPHQDAVGKRLRLHKADGPLVEIVGVAKLSKYIFVAEPPFEFLYLPLSQNPRSAMTLMLHTTGPSADSAEAVRQLVRSLDPSQPIVGLRTIEDFYNQRARGTMQVLIETVGGLGLVGLVLALVGLYGLMAYSVGLRQREIGIRMAIGAEPRGVRAMVLKQGMILAGGGCAIGLVLSLAASRPATALIGSSPFYLPLVGLVFFALLAVGALAAYIPARRASQLDPNIILRQD